MHIHEHKVDLTGPFTYNIPEDAHSIGAVEDQDRVLLFGFKSKREVFFELGYMVMPADDEALSACGKLICDMLRMEAVIKAMTITPESVMEYIKNREEEGTEETPVSYSDRDIAMTLVAVRQAVLNYAAGKKK